jgi:hypothetical protein
MKHNRLMNEPKITKGLGITFESLFAALILYQAQQENIRALDEVYPRMQKGDVYPRRYARSVQQQLIGAGLP